MALDPVRMPSNAGGAPGRKPLGEAVVRLCTAPASVSSLLASDPSLAPGDAWQTLYGSYTPEAADGHGQAPAATEAADLARAAQCGKWGPARPSELFLKIYRDVLAVVEESPSRAMVSPSLLGSYGVAPLTVISTIPDIARHMANSIARADREVFLVTNYWQDSVASRYLTGAMRELDRRAGQRGVRVVMKIVYDRGSAKQVVDPHCLVGVDEYAGQNVCIPRPEEVPNIDVQVMNYHQPLMGTFHAKYMVVDRRVALLQSNNIQDNDNLEMMVRYEGPIVDSFYDMALLSWHKRLEPPLPCLAAPAAAVGLDGSRPGEPANTWLSNAAPSPRERTGRPLDDSAALGEHGAQAALGAGDAAATAGAGVPNVPNGPDAATQAFLDSGAPPPPSPAAGQAIPPNPPLLQSTPERPQFDASVADEVARVQASVAAPPDGAGQRMEAVRRLLNHTTNQVRADAPACADGDAMTPYIPDATRTPFPIAMVNRPPFGPPTHSAVVQPQNAAWLSALRNARRTVFIQTPTLNAAPLVAAIAAACERGLDVICYVCLGYNDAGGTNEMVAHQLYASLSEAGRQRLHYFWYVAKDQTRPLPQSKKMRSCHIKLMIVDESVGIMGNGNQDTQSWYHSQEANAMLDSPGVCRAWIGGLRRNQNTHLYGGLCKEDGVWRDHEGNGAAGAMGIDPGRFSWAKGLVGAVKRVQGKGGF